MNSLLAVAEPQILYETKIALSGIYRVLMLPLMMYGKKIYIEHSVQFFNGTVRSHVIIAKTS